MIIKVYRRVDIVEAEQFDGSDIMREKYGIEHSSNSGYNDSDWEDEGWTIPTNRGYLRINEGDWIVVQPDRSYHIVNDKVFKSHYEQVVD